MKFVNLCFVVGMLLVSSMLTGCGTKVESGYVGIKVYTMGNRGVDVETLPVGRYIAWIGQDIYTFPIFQQTFNWTKTPSEGNPTDESITFQTKEGMSINVDMGISYTLAPDKITILFQKYRKGVEEITDIVLRNAVRDHMNKIASTYVVEDIYGVKKAEFISKISDAMKAQFAPLGINIENIYVIGEMRLPPTVLAALNSKIEATQTAQRIQNEVLQAKAQAEKQIAIARGEAEANRLKQTTITEQLLRYEAIQKWNGVLPSVTSGAVPFINIK